MIRRRAPLQLPRRATASVASVGILPGIIVFKSVLLASPAACSNRVGSSAAASQNDPHQERPFPQGRPPHRNIFPSLAVPGVIISMLRLIVPLHYCESPALALNV